MKHLYTLILCLPLIGFGLSGKQKFENPNSGCDSIQDLVIAGSTVGFTSFLENYFIDSYFDYTNLSIDWIVDGGYIQYTYANGIDVLWGNEGLGVIDLILTDTISNCFSTYQIEVNISNPPLGYILTGCDSVYSEINNFYVYDSELASIDTLITQIGGDSIVVELITIDTLINQFGGDSIVVELITIFNSPDSLLIDGNIEVLSLTMEYYEIAKGLKYNESLEWNVEGGWIWENNNNNIQVLWGDEGVGFIELTETDTNGCSTTSTLEVIISNESTKIDDNKSKRKVIKFINFFAQENATIKNQPIIEIYNDGSVEKKYIID